jgi:hypothetical protein
VTGESPGIGTEGDYATIKYDLNGTELWVALYNGPANNDDYAYALVVDDSGNVYVTGQSTGIGTGWDYATIKYSEIVPGVENDPSSHIPDEFALRGPYPNPFNPTTTISFDLPVASQVKLDVFDINGNRVGVACPLGGIVPTGYNPGTHQITFDGSGLASGVYIYRLEAEEYRASGKMVLLK